MVVSKTYHAFRPKLTFLTTDIQVPKCLCVCERVHYSGVVEMSFARLWGVWLRVCAGCGACSVYTCILGKFEFLLLIDFRRRYIKIIKQFRCSQLPATHKLVFANKGRPPWTIFFLFFSALLYLTFAVIGECRQVCERNKMRHTSDMCQ